MNEPIPVSLAVRAVERAIRDCAAATPGPWILRRGYLVARSDGETILEQPDNVALADFNAEFAILSRAGFRAALEYLRDDLTAMEGEMALPHHRRAVAPLIQHYDATRPDWRTE